MSWFQNCLILEIELQLAHKFFQNLKRQVWEIRFFVCGDPPTHICPYQWPPSNPHSPSSSPSKFSLPGLQTSLPAPETSSPILETPFLDHPTSCLACHSLPRAPKTSSSARRSFSLANSAFLARSTSLLARESLLRVLSAKIPKAKPKQKSNPVAKAKADSPPKQAPWAAKRKPVSDLRRTRLNPFLLEESFPIG